jgi:hypothetical protein
MTSSYIRKVTKKDIKSDRVIKKNDINRSSKIRGGENFNITHNKKP